MYRKEKQKMYTWQKCIVLETAKIRKICLRTHVIIGERGIPIYTAIYIGIPNMRMSQREKVREKPPVKLTREKVTRVARPFGH